MSIWQRLVTVIFLLATIVNSAVADDHFSNIIILGDSLSDIGNVPESTQAHRSDGRLVYNLYVPFSNPVIFTSNRYSLVNHPQIKLLYPDFSHTLTLPQAQLDGSRRIYRSSNWSQYLLQDIQQLHPNWQVPTTLTSWVYLHTPGVTVPTQTSMSYAFGSAMTEDYCCNIDYENPHNDCSATSIYAAQQHYRIVGNNGFMPDIQIPGLLRQVTLLQQDVNAKRIKVTPNTIYIIWIGGNDIKNAYQNLQDWHNLGHVFYGLKALFGGISSNVQHAVQQLVLADNIHARKIIVMNMYEIGLTPYAYNSPLLHTLAKLFTGIYNFSLRLALAPMTSQQHIQVQLFDTHQLINDLANQANFHTTLGTACQQLPNYNMAAAETTNCENYLFWDNFHLTTPVQQVIGYALLQPIAATLN